MPLKVSDYWVTRMKSAFANTSLSDEAIWWTFAAEGRQDFPGERTINRYRAAWKKLSEEERAAWRVVRWPESFMAGELPWEAAPAALEMLASGRYPGRPLVSGARWFHRVTQAAPGAAYNWREWAALQLAAAEVVGGPEAEAATRPVEAWLADHAAGRVEPRSKPPVIMRRVKIPAGASRDTFLAVAEALRGFALDAEMTAEIRTPADEKDGAE